MVFWPHWGISKERGGVESGLGWAVKCSWCVVKPQTFPKALMMICFRSQGGIRLERGERTEVGGKRLAGDESKSPGRPSIAVGLTCRTSSSDPKHPFLTPHSTTLMIYYFSMTPHQFGLDHHIFWVSTSKG